MVIINILLLHTGIDFRRQNLNIYNDLRPNTYTHPSIIDLDFCTNYSKAFEKQDNTQW